jgi:hypothetical protein
MEVSNQSAKEEEERLQQEALADEVERQSNNPLLSEAEWKDHVSKCLLPFVRCIISRFETGDRSEAVQFYRGVPYAPCYG